MEQQKGTEITVDWQDGDSTVHSAADIWNMIFNSNQPWMLTANGTIVTYERKGVVPGLLERWYAERKDLQKTKNLWNNLSSGIKLPERLTVSQKNQSQ